MTAVVPVFVIVTVAVKPVLQSLVTYPTEQAPATGGGAVVTATGADAAEVLPAASTATT
nr:hypothetical protein [Micromonospora cremea]